MFKAALRSARPAVLAVRAGARASPAPALRTLSTSAIRRSDDHKPAAPLLFGPGAKPGEVPTDENQSTGLDRVEVLGLIEGVDVFDMDPLDSSRNGTLADPIKVFSVEHERIVGCTGSPADSHDLHWFTVTSEKPRRCAECGSAYIIDVKANEVAVEEIYPQEEIAAPHHH